MSNSNIYPDESDSINKHPEFLPTILYIKQHSVTGLLYFGKTTRIGSNLEKYKGSGKRWLLHLEKHGRQFVSTIWFCLFTEREELIKFAISCSALWNIVLSESWANLKPEDGIAGGSVKGGKHSPEFIEKRIAKQRGVKRGHMSTEQRDKIAKSSKGKKKSEEFKEKLRKPKTKDHATNISIARTGKPQKIVICPHCFKEGGSQVMKRWHFDNCSLQLSKM